MHANMSNFEKRQNVAICIYICTAYMYAHINKYFPVSSIAYGWVFRWQIPANFIQQKANEFASATVTMHQIVVGLTFICAGICLYLLYV